MKSLFQNVLKRSFNNLNILKYSKYSFSDIPQTTDLKENGKYKKKGKQIKERIICIKPRDMKNQVDVSKDEPSNNKHNVYFPKEEQIKAYEEKMLSKVNYTSKQSIYEGDLVKVVKGEFKDKEGIVKRISPDKSKIMIFGVNLKDHFIEPHKLNQIYKEKYEKYPVKQFAQYIDMSLVKLISPHTKNICNPLIVDEDNKTFKRICPESQHEIPIKKKSIPNKANKHLDYKDTYLDTKESSIRIITYKGPDYSSIAADFLSMQKEKKEIESKLILKDKFYLEI